MNSNIICDDVPNVLSRCVGCVSKVGGVVAPDLDRGPGKLMEITILYTVIVRAALTLGLELGLELG